MNNHTTTIVGAALGLALVAAQSASAVTTTFDSRGLWEAAASGVVSVETFESEALGFLTQPTTLDSGLGISLASGNVTSSIGLEVSDYGIQNTTPGGRNVLWFDEDNGTGNYIAQFTLTDGVSAFGFDISGWQSVLSAGGPTGGTNLTLLSNGQVVDDFFLPSNAEFDDVSFIGLTSNTRFDEVRVQIPQIELLWVSGADTVGFDDVAWVVPTPGAASLLAIGGLAATRRER